MANHYLDHSARQPRPRRSRRHRYADSKESIFFFSLCNESTQSAATYKKENFAWVNAWIDCLWWSCPASTALVFAQNESQAKIISTALPSLLAAWELNVSARKGPSNSMIKRVRMYFGNMQCFRTISRRMQIAERCRISEYSIDYRIFEYYLPNSNIPMENSESERWFFIKWWKWHSKDTF